MSDTSNSELEVLRSEAPVSAAEAEQCYVALGQRNVSPSDVEKAVTAYKWMCQTGVKAIVVADLMEHRGFWKSICDQWDKVALGDGDVTLTKEDLQAYLEFRLQVTQTSLKLSDQLVKFCDPKTAVKKNGIRASSSGMVTAPLPIMNPVPKPV